MLIIKCEYCDATMSPQTEKDWLKVDEYDPDYRWQTGEPVHHCHYCPECKGYYTIAKSYAMKMAQKYGPGKENDKKCLKDFDTLVKV